MPERKVLLASFKIYHIICGVPVATTSQYMLCIYDACISSHTRLSHKINFIFHVLRSHLHIRTNKLTNENPLAEHLLWPSTRCHFTPLMTRRMVAKLVLEVCVSHFSSIFLPLEVCRMCREPHKEALPEQKKNKKKNCSKMLVVSAKRNSNETKKKNHAHPVPTWWTTTSIRRHSCGCIPPKRRKRTKRAEMKSVRRTLMHARAITTLRWKMIFEFANVPAMCERSKWKIAIAIKCM